MLNILLVNNMQLQIVSKKKNLIREYSMNIHK